MARAGFERLALDDLPGGVRMRLRVKAGSRRNALLGVHDGALKLCVTAAPERGKANRAVLALLGECLGVAPSRIELVSGVSSADKTVTIPLARNVLLERLSDASCA